MLKGQTNSQMHRVVSLSLVDAREVAPRKRRIGEEYAESAQRRGCMIQPLSIEPLHKPIWKYLLPWVLVFPMVVFAVSSDFSFQAGARNTAAVSITSASIEGKGQ